ncbi:Thiamine-monophosphate kinase [Raoultella terrigena]|uniref:Thiamine-monophosphate kinase n=1 Tax=Raoultella terrigena TaxID=577 RepID=A0A4V6YW67_RAOTE|nr:Thiamine-monophosphate kinase [Raoultella terrigena]
MLLNYYDMQLIGGDTTRGPLSMTLGIHGFVPPGRALKRSGAKPGGLDLRDRYAR